MCEIVSICACHLLAYVLYLRRSETHRASACVLLMQALAHLPVHYLPTAGRLTLLPISPPHTFPRPTTNDQTCMSRAFTCVLCSIATIAAALTAPCLKSAKTALQYDDEMPDGFPLRYHQLIRLTRKGTDGAFAHCRRRRLTTGESCAHAAAQGPRVPLLRIVCERRGRSFGCRPRLHPARPFTSRCVRPRDLPRDSPGKQRSHHRADLFGQRV